MPTNLGSNSSASLLVSSASKFRKGGFKNYHIEGNHSGLTTRPFSGVSSSQQAAYHFGRKITSADSNHEIVARAMGGQYSHRPFSSKRQNNNHILQVRESDGGGGSGSSPIRNPNTISMRWSQSNFR